MKMTRWIWVFGAALLAVACIVQPSLTPPPSATPADPLQTADTPTPPAVSAATPRLFSFGGRTFKQYAQPPLMTIDQAASHTAIIRTNKGQITLELFASEAPVTVNNFVFLARDGFYDGVIFHRVIRDFMVQTGDPTGTGTGGPGYSFNDEPVTRSYSPGIVAMANGGRDTNGSQFFIVHGTKYSLQPTFTIFGQVTLGMDTVNDLADTPVGPTAGGELSVPTETLRIQSIEIITTGAR
jgi:cyclophilin family peptidyl-prolyl cis-trans isomerase